MQHILAESAKQSRQLFEHFLHQHNLRGIAELFALFSRLQLLQLRVRFDRLQTDIQQTATLH